MSGRKRTLFRSLLKLVPGVFSLLLVGWLIWRLSFSKLADAVAVLDFSRLGPATVALVVGLYLWDSVCLKWLFGQLWHPPDYRTTLQARGSSYLLSALNYELGQGLLAWQLARVLRMPVLWALGGCLLLAVHDVAVLLLIGLAGSLASSDPRAEGARTFCLVGVACFAAFVLLVWLLLTRFRGWLAEERWGLWRTWGWRRSLTLCLLRTAYVGIMLTYAATALAICSIPVNFSVVVSVIPLVLLADGLPLSASGLGTREAAMLYLLEPDDPAVLLACSLIWSTGLMTGRVVIGLAWWPPFFNWCFPRQRCSNDRNLGDGGDGVRRQPPDR